MNKIQKYDPIDWRDSPNGPVIEVTWDYTCTEWVGKNNCRIFELEHGHPLYENGKEVARATINVWSGCPCGERHFSVRAEV
jgi:hypothetical protein